MSVTRLASGLLVFIAAGCARGPAAIPPPEVDPRSAADQAIELYDADHDGALGKDELAKCPGILAKLTAYDKNGSGSVDRDEIAARLTELVNAKIALTRLQCHVTYRGRPLANATVTLEPEPYLGEEVKTASGVTDAQGRATVSLPAEELPQHLQRMSFLHTGTFKVRITHPSVKLPARFNTATELGYESEIGNPFAEFSLKDK